MNKKVKQAREQQATGIKCLTLGERGYFNRAGIPCVLLDAVSTKVYLGPVGKEVPVENAKFSLLFDNGCIRENCEYGRDFVFAPKDSQTTPKLSFVAKRSKLERLVGRSATQGDDNEEVDCNQPARR